MLLVWLRVLPERMQRFSRVLKRIPLNKDAKTLVSFLMCPFDFGEFEELCLVEWNLHWAAWPGVPVLMSSYPCVPP